MNQEDIDICRNIATTVFEKVENLLEGQVGNPKAGEFVKIGADGTPTSYIDIIAEDEVIKLLKDADFKENRKQSVLVKNCLIMFLKPKRKGKTKINLDSYS